MVMALASLFCPLCKCENLFKDGFHRRVNEEKAQRWLCRECGHRFTEPKPLLKKPERRLSNDVGLLLECQVGDNSSRMSKNLAINPQELRLAGTTAADAASDRGKIIEHAFWMKKEGFAEATISRRIRFLSTLVKRGANLENAESVKECIATQTWSPRTKEIACETYSCFLSMQGKTWKPPKYKSVRKLPFIPTEEELSNLIAGCNRKTAAFLQLLKETGMRCGEAFMLQWTDFDFDNRTVNITPEKGSEPRQLLISSQLVAMLYSLPKNNAKPFECSQRHFARTFRQQRKRIANKLQDDRIRKIHFHTLRHWKATMEYAKTKDILHVMKLLGHRNIQNTLLYTQVINFKNDEYFSATAKTIQEAQVLVEAGFQYECDFGDTKLFKKRK